MRWLCGTALLLLSLASASARPDAGTHWWGIVIGVGQYPNFDAALSLEGPPRDVPLVTQWLERQGVPRTHLTLLADQVAGADGLPTRQPILEALQRLALQVPAGDLAFIYFAGHGSQEPQGSGRWSKPDGLEEIFLPRDAGHWDRRSRQVEGAITGREIGQAIDTLRSRGVFVWFVSDSCHSATLARAVLVPRFKLRAIAPTRLRIPEGAGATTAAGGSDRIVQVDDKRFPGGYVAFYAAQTTESAPEMPLPADDARSNVHGLFTYALLKALAAAPARNYRELSHRILAFYGATYPATTPEFEGALDLPVGAPAAPLRATELWPAERHGDGFHLELGRLSGLTTDSLVTLYPALEGSRADRPVGLLKVSRVDLTDAWAVPVTDAGLLLRWKIQPHHTATVLPSGLVRVVQESHETTVRIAGPAACFVGLPPPYGCGAAGKPASTPMLAKLQRLLTTPGVLPGAARLENAPQTADLIALVKGSKMLLVRPGSIGGTPAEIDLDTTDVARRVQSLLFRAVRATALLRLAAEFAGDSRDLEADVRVRAPDGSWRSLGKAADAPVSFGAQMAVRLHNVGAADLDVTLLAIDEQFGITPVFPVDQETNLLRAGTAPIEITGWARTRGVNQILLVVENARDGRPHDLGYLAQPGVARHAEEGGFEGLLERVGFSATHSRSALNESERREFSLGVVRYEVLDRS